MALLDKIRRHSVVMHNLLQPFLGQRVEGDVKNLLLEIMPIAKAPFQVLMGPGDKPLLHVHPCFIKYDTHAGIMMM